MSTPAIVNSSQTFFFLLRFANTRLGDVEILLDRKAIEFQETSAEIFHLIGNPDFTCAFTGLRLT